MQNTTSLILLANVRSLENKMDYLKMDKMGIEELLRHSSDGDMLNSFVPDDAGKCRGGSVCIYIHNSWCNNAEVVASYCSSLIEFLTVGPFYLPREFTVITITAVYISPHANTKEDLSVFLCSISDLQNTHLEVIFIVAGDSNRANMKTVFPLFHQCGFSTRAENTLDLAYTNIKKASKAALHPHLDCSDHLYVMLIPVYKPLLIRGKPNIRR